MLPVTLSGRSRAEPPSVLALGAHPDDIEIGCGGTLLRLASVYPGLRAHVVVLTGSSARAQEARASAPQFLPDTRLSIDVLDLADGRLPAQWRQVKDALEEVAARSSADIVLAPHAGDAHQDHRTIAEQVGTVWRDQFVLGYEVPKYDGDLVRPSFYVPLPPEVARRKVELLHASFPSQKDRSWFDDEVFLGLARLRGMECRSRYAEAFVVDKAVLSLPGEREQG